jgi:heme iron utilization protein
MAKNLPGQRDAPKVLQTTDEAARQAAKALVASSRYAALASSEPGSGWPLASRVSVAMTAQAEPLILISRLSAHYAALEAEPRCSLLLGEVPSDASDPLRHARISLLCQARKIPLEQRADARAVFVAQHPAAELYADFTDFDFWHLSIQRASYNAGFARAYALEPHDLLKSI